MPFPFSKTLNRMTHFFFKSLLLFLVAILPLGGAPPELKVMAWNIWRAGVKKEPSGKPVQVARLIKSEMPDLVAMQETYGSGPWLKEQLGYEMRLRGPHLSLFSRYPILADLSVGEEWNCLGALIDVPDFGKIAFFSIWLPFKGDIWKPGSREGIGTKEMLAVCEPSRVTLAVLLPAIEKKLAEQNLSGIPVIMAGDYNSMSHLDYTRKAANQFDGKVIAWPTSQLMIKAGFIDTYRQVHPVVDREKDSTWSPEFRDQEQDRIDFIYARGDALSPKTSAVLDSFEPMFPSDHAAVVTVFGRTNDDNVK
jgi:exonuclease III